MGLAKFSINGVDYSDCVARAGLGWARHDLDKDGSGRSLDSYMHRHRIAQKRTLKVQCKILTDARGRQLATALDPETISVTYNDLKFGVVTKTFYGTDVEGGIWGEKNNTLYWENISFQLTEV